MIEYECAQGRGADKLSMKSKHNNKIAAILKIIIIQNIKSTRQKMALTCQLLRPLD